MMNKKVLIVSNMYPDEKNPTYGIFVKRFTDNMSDINVEYDLSVMTKPKNVIDKILKYFLFYAQTFKKCINKKYKCIYIHYASFSSPPVLLANKIRKTKIISNVHGSDVVPENKLQKFMNKFTKQILNKSIEIVVPSEYFKLYVEKKYKVNDKKIIIYPSSGIDTNVFFKNQSNKSELVNKNANLKIAYVGRISYKKGWDTYIKAIANLKNYFNKIDFYIVGSGNKTCEKELDNLIDFYNLNLFVKRIPLLNQYELSKFYNSIDCLIFPTEREGESLGLVGLEAMACGVPVIASDFAAPSYYVKEGYNGFKFKIKNYQELSQKIKKFYNLDLDKKEDLSKNSLETAKKYSKNNTRSILLEIFKIIEKEE